MRNILLLTSYVFVLIIIICAANITYADSPIIIIEPEPHSQEDTRQKEVPFEVQKPFSWIFEPKIYPDSAGPVEMVFNFKPTEHCVQCNEVTLTVTTEKGLKCLGPESWVVSVDTSTSYSTTLNIILPPNDTSRICVRMQSGNIYSKAVRYFVTTGDLVEYWKGYPSGRYWKYPKYEPDTNKYEIRIDLSNKKRYEIIKHFQDAEDAIRATSDSGIYIIKVTQSQFDKLRREGFKCEYLTEPPPQKGEQHKIKVKPKRIGGNNGCKQQKPERDDEASIWLDYIDGEDQNGRLPANQLIRFVLVVPSIVYG